MNTELLAQYRNLRNIHTAAQALRSARCALNLKAKPEIEFSTNEQFIEWQGFYVRVQVVYDDHYSLSDDDFGTVHGLGKRLDADDVAYYGIEGEFTFGIDMGWDRYEIVGFDTPEGSSFDDLLGYYRNHAKLSKQMAYEAARRSVRQQFDMVCRMYDEGNDDFQAYGVVAEVYESEEAYDDGDGEVLGESSCWGFVVDTARWHEADEQIKEFAWEQVEEAVWQAQRAEYESKKRAGNVPLFEGVN